MDGIEMALAAFGLLFLLAGVTFWEWKRRDDARRLQRLRQRGLA